MSILIFAISSRILCKISKQLFILFRPCLFFLWPFSFLTYLFDPNTCKGTNEKIISISWEKLSNLFYYRHIYMRWGSLCSSDSNTHDHTQSVRNRAKNLCKKVTLSKYYIKVFIFFGKYNFLGSQKTTLCQFHFHKHWKFLISCQISLLLIFDLLLLLFCKFEIHNSALNTYETYMIIS